MRRHASLSVQYQGRPNAVVLGSSPSSLLWAVTVSSCSLHLQQVKFTSFYKRITLYSDLSVRWDIQTSTAAVTHSVQTHLNDYRQTWIKRWCNEACNLLMCPLLFCLPDFSSFYNLLKNCRGHRGERSVFSERTEESSAVQYFQVCFATNWHAYAKATFDEPVLTHLKTLRDHFKWVITGNQTTI